MLLVLLLRCHSQQILALAQQKDYKDVIKMTKQAIKSQMDKINSELSVYKPADMKITALVRKEWKISEELKQLAQNVNFNAKKDKLNLSNNARL